MANRHHKPLVQECSNSAECPCMCLIETWLVILDCCVLVIAEDHRHHLMHLYRLCIIWKGLDSVVWVFVSKCSWGWWTVLGDLVSTWICIVMHKSCKELCNLSKILDELSVVAYNTKESPYLFCLLWWSHEFNLFSRVGVLYWLYWGHGPNIEFLWQRSRTCLLSWIILHCKSVKNLL